jgi:histidinol-phosphate/aromatic aminotransferase/cobyric acid decarboxylase-like protein/adenosyl cobinamide kinase/adenosyl cobinamide phosphate guanylyltransferase
MSLTLVIGGTRSGKSLHAERIAIAAGLPVRYVATADGSDPAMARRIADHAARRPEGWHVVEVGDALGEALTQRAGTCVLVDGLGVWIAGVLHRAGVPARAVDGLPAEDGVPGAEDGVPGAEDGVPGAEDGVPGDAYARAREHVLAQVEQLTRVVDDPAPVIVVAEHAGEGVLPVDAASRAWLDLLGEAVQQLSAAAMRVELVVAGRPLVLERACGSGGVAGAHGPVEMTWPSQAHGAPRKSPQDLRRHGDREVRPGDADHAVNVMAGGPPDWLRETLHDALDQSIDRYPDEREACEAVALVHGRDPREVVPTNGAAEALWLLPAALQPTLAACVHPAFTEAEAALRAHGTPVVRVMREADSDFALDPFSVPQAADLVIVGNPASPCGTLTPAATLLQLRRAGRVLVVDEAFMDLVPGEPGTLARDWLDDVIVVRSLTKALSIPGLRAGYALAGAGLAERLRAVRPPWSANALALVALQAAARRPDALAAQSERARSEREDLLGRLAAIPGMRTWPGTSNFCLVEVPDGPAVLHALREQSIAVRPAASFPGLGSGHLRITARDPAANERLASTLSQAVAACS